MSIPIRIITRHDVSAVLSVVRKRVASGNNIPGFKCENGPTAIVDNEVVFNQRSTVIRGCLPWRSPAIEDDPISIRHTPIIGT